MSNTKNSLKKKGIKTIKTIRDNVVAEIIKRISTWLTAIIFSLSYLYYDQVISLVCYKTEDKITYSLYNFNTTLKKVDQEIIAWNNICGEHCLTLQVAIVPSLNVDYFASVLSLKSSNKNFKELEFKDPIFLGDLSHLLEHLKHSPSKCNAFNLKELPERELTKILDKLQWKSERVLICVLPKTPQNPKILLLTFIANKNQANCGNCAKELSEKVQKIDVLWNKVQKH